MFYNQGPLHFQKLVKKEVMEHRKKEENQGGVEIWPATPKLAGSMQSCSAEEMFCSKLDMESCSASRELDW